MKISKNKIMITAIIVLCVAVAVLAAVLVIRKDKNKDNDEQHTHTKSTFGEFGKVKLTPEEHAKIVADGLTDYIARVDAYKASTGKRYSSDYATIRNWARKDGQGKRVEPIPEYKTEASTIDVAELKARLSKLGGKA